MIMQLDMFGAAPPRIARPAPPAPVAALPVPPRTPAWESRLARSPAGGTITVLVTTLWTGIILEVLSCPVQGRLWLDRDGAIGEYPADSAHGRVIYATIAMARAWHAKRALIAAGDAGTHGARFRFGDAPGVGALIFPPPFIEAEP